MFASKQFFVDEQNTCFEISQPKERKSKLVLWKNFGQKKEIKGVSIFLYPAEQV